MKPKFFDIAEIQDAEIIEDESSTSPVKSGIHVEQFLQLHEFRINSIKDLIGQKPTENQVYFLWSVHSFNAFTFIPYSIKECGQIMELIIATYSISTRIIEALIKLIDKGLVLSVHITISDSIRTRLPQVYDQLMILVETKPVTVLYSWNHSKIALIRTREDYFIVEGSGNWGENAQHEQYVFLNSKSVFEFRKNEILNAIKPRTV